MGDWAKCGLCAEKNPIATLVEVAPRVLWCECCAELHPWPTGFSERDAVLRQVGEHRSDAEARRLSAPNTSEEVGGE